MDMVQAQGSTNYAVAVAMVSVSQWLIGLQSALVWHVIRIVSVSERLRHIITSMII